LLSYLAVAVLLVGYGPLCWAPVEPGGDKKDQESIAVHPSPPKTAYELGDTQFVISATNPKADAKAAVNSSTFAAFKSRTLTAFLPEDEDAAAREKFRLRDTPRDVHDEPKFNLIIGASRDGKYLYLAQGPHKFWVTPSPTGNWTVSAVLARVGDAGPATGNGSFGRLGDHPPPEVRAGGESTIENNEIPAIALTDSIFGKKLSKHDATVAKFFQKSGPAVVFDDTVLNLETLPSEMQSGEATFLSRNPPPPVYDGASRSQFEKPSSRKPRSGSRMTIQEFNLQEDWNPVHRDWYARMLGCCFYDRIPPDGFFINWLEKRPFDKKNVHLINFRENENVENSIRDLATDAGKSSVWNPRLFAKNPMAALQKIFSAARGQTAVVVGHVDENRVFVSDGDYGKVRFKVSIDELMAMASQEKVRLVLLGCQTAGAEGGSQGRHVLTLTDIDERLVIQQLSKALNGAKNWADFFSNLAAPNMPLVASGSDFDYSSDSLYIEHEIKIFKLVSAAKKHGQATYRHIATLWLRLCVLTSACEG